jgi:hypothetical protein
MNKFTNLSLHERVFEMFPMFANRFYNREYSTGRNVNSLYIVFF